MEQKRKLARKLLAAEREHMTALSVRDLEPERYQRARARLAEVELEVLQMLRAEQTYRRRVCART